MFSMPLNPSCIILLYILTITAMKPVGASVMASSITGAVYLEGVTAYV